MVKIKKVRSWATTPVLGSAQAAAFDVVYCAAGGQFENEMISYHNVTIRPGEVKTVGTGLAFEVPDDMAMLILPRSGLATKQRLRPANAPGLLDPDYRGELIIALENFGEHDQLVTHNMRIAQILFVPIARQLSFEVVDELTPTDRGEDGFGSTGVN